MLDLTLVKDLTEMLGKSLTFTDIEVLGKYFFKDYNTHKLAKIPDTQTISPLNAAKVLVDECSSKNKLDDFFKFVIELDGTPLNSRVVKLIGLENILYRLSRTGIYFDFNKRKFSSVSEDKKMMVNWGALKDAKEYPMIVASIDICSNSELVKKYKPQVMEKIYYQLWEFLKKKMIQYDGRIWTWAGDGGIIAFRNDKGPSFAVSCLLEILLTMPVYNSWHTKAIDEDIDIRIGADMGNIKFFEDTGRIVSDVINYAAHLEKKATNANGLSISETIYKELGKKMKEMFVKKFEFEGKISYSLNYDFCKTIC
jgi:class 3 adenylate cyclase